MWLKSQGLCTIPEQLFEAQLFGHEVGAFTGAVKSTAGVFELAHGGTLFLDEIGELPTALQAKLLRVLQDGEIRRVGDKQSRRVDTRVVAATARDLEADTNRPDAIALDHADEDAPAHLPRELGAG